MTLHIDTRGQILGAGLPLLQMECLTIFEKKVIANIR